MEWVRGIVGRRGWVLCLAALLSAGVGCGGSAQPEPETPGEYLDSWEGALRSLFDDSIHPAAVGLALDERPVHLDPLLSSRIKTAELVARMRVSTVTADSVGAKVTYYLNLQVGYPTLLPSELTERNYEIAIRKTSPSFGIVSNLDTTLQGRTFIAFIRRFAGPHEAEIHWHLTADDPKVAQVIANTAVLDEAAGE